MTFKPHWTQTDDTYVQEPPDQLKARGYLADEVPTHNETNWLYRNLMPIRMFDTAAAAASTLLAGQVGLLPGEETVGSRVLASRALTYGNTAAVLACDGVNVYVAKDDGTTQTIIYGLSVSDLSTTQTFEAVSGAPVAIATDGVYVVGVTSTQLHCWSVETGLKLWSVSVLTTPRSVYIHGKYIYVASNDYARQYQLSNGTQVASIQHDEDVTSVVAYGTRVYFGGVAGPGTGATALGTNVFAADVATSFTLMEEGDSPNDVTQLACNGEVLLLGIAGSRTLIRTGLAIGEFIEDASLELYGTAGLTCTKYLSFVSLLSNDGVRARRIGDERDSVFVHASGHTYDASWPTAPTTLTSDGFHLYAWHPATETLYKVALPGKDSGVRMVMRRADYTTSQHVPASVAFPHLLLQPL